MTFFLLGRASDNTLSLLSDSAFESRQDAMAELSRITSDAGFDRWDDEVLLLDIETGTPVLLVRPSAPVLPAPAAPETEESDAGVFAALADEVPEALAPEAVEEIPALDEFEMPTATSIAGLEDVVEIAEPEPEPAAEILEPAAEPAVAEPQPEPLVEPAEPEPEPLMELPTPEPAPSPVAAEPAPVVEPAPLAEPEETEPASMAADEIEDLFFSKPAADLEIIPAKPEIDAEEVADADLSPETPAEATDESGFDGLREAIARTTEQMEAAGIVAPASVGPAEVAAEPLDEAAPAAAAEAEAPSAVPEPEMPAWPWATEAEETAADADVEAPDAAAAEGDAATGADEPAPAEPTAQEFAADVALLLEGLEEPASDGGGSLIAATMDDTELASSRPVILGAYDEPPVAQFEPPAAEPESGEAPVQSRGATEPATAIAPPEDSDFIVLDDAPASPATDEPAGQQEAADDGLTMSVYTCNDCVYVDTCPNKDQRLPEDCGSFQWK